MTKVQPSSRIKAICMGELLFPEVRKILPLESIPAEAVKSLCATAENKSNDCQTIL